MNYLIKFDNLGYGLTNKDLRVLVYRYAFANGLKHKFSNELQMAGKDWVMNFLKRHKSLSVRVAESLSYARARGLSREKVKEFYENLSSLLDKHNLWNKPGSIFNCDETGLQLIYKPKKVISQRGKKDVVSQTNCEKGETISVMACVSASGQYVPPFIVMKGRRYNDNFEIGMPPGSKIVLSDSGYMKWEQFAQFLDHFISVKPSGTVILILDGHGSHCSDPPTLEKAVAHDIVLLCLPPHSTHKLQPLDVSFFAPLKTFFNDACRLYVRRYPGRGINKVAFGGIFAEAWNRAATVGNGVSGFRSCGIYPFNPNSLPDHVFCPGQVHLQNEQHENAQPNIGNDIFESQNQPPLDVQDAIPDTGNNYEVHSSETQPGQTQASTPSTSFEQISPPPRTSLEVKGKPGTKRKSRKSEVLTSPEFINDLKMRKTARAEKEKTVAAKARNTGAKKKLAYETEDICKKCQKSYKEGENWVQCLNCENWYHVRCVEAGNDPYFKCDSCMSDDSD